MINIPGQKDKVAIVVVGYNRLGGMKRLMSSLLNASYPNKDVPLILSIDASGNGELYNYVNSIDWPYGRKFVNIENERLGLIKHIFQCGGLSRKFKAVIILEDDLFVSPDFYNYVLAAIDAYGEDENVSGIALYQEETNGFVSLPFSPMNNGSDCYAMQSVCSWGEVWNQRMWTGFEMWLEKWDRDFTKIDMMECIKGWKKAWSKFFYAYIISTNKYFIFPYVSLSTNFNDAGGEHGGGLSSIVQVNLLQGRRNYNFSSFKDLEKYDVYQQNIFLYSVLKLSPNDLTLDLYGIKFKEGKVKRYILTTYHLPYKRIKEYGICMRPIELNVINEIPGSGIYLYDTSVLDEKWPVSPCDHSIDYFIRGCNTHYLLNYLKRLLYNKIKTRMGL